MRRAPVLAALLSHWRRAPLQLVTLVLGLALATALWSGVQAINAEARASYARAEGQASAAGQARILAGQGASLDQADFIALRRAGWQVTPQITGFLPHASGEISVIGLEPLTFGNLNEMPGATEEFDLARFLAGEALVGSQAGRDALIARGFAARVSAALEPDQAILDIGAAQRLFERGTQLDALFVTGPASHGAAKLAQIAPHLRQEAAAGASDMARLTESFHLNLTAFGLLSFAVGVFIVYGAIGLAFEQRRALFRTLRALGVPLADLIVILLIELTLLALFAGILGIVMGYALAAALLPDVAATLSGLYGAQVSGSLQIRPVWWASGLVMALLGTLLAALGTLMRLARLPVLEAGAPQIWAAQSRKGLRWMLGLGLALLITALIWMLWTDGLIQGFAVMGALLIGAALMLPMVLDLALGALAGRARAPLRHWFWSDTRMQVPGLSMALMALLLAISANVGVSTMVSSFRLTFTGWLDQRLASELYIRAETAEQAAQITAHLSGRVDAILPLLNTTAELGGEQGQIYAIADHATYRDHWPLLSAAPDVWDLVQQEGYVLINEQLARRSGLAVGDQLPGAEGGQIVGIYSDYGNPAPQVILGIGPFQKRYPQVHALQFGVRLDPQQSEAVITSLRAAVPLAEDAIADQSEIKTLSMRIFERTFAITSALNVLTLSVAGVSLLLNLLTLSDMRLPQLAPVWALGVGRSALARMELTRALCLAALVFVLALPLGLALAWVLLAVVNVAAFGWQLPMFFFPRAYLVLGAASLLAAMLAAAWPAVRLSRRAPRDLLQVFSVGR